MMPRGLIYTRTTCRRSKRPPKDPSALWQTYATMGKLMFCSPAVKSTA